MRAELLDILNAERAARRATILVTDIADGAQRLVLEADIAADPLATVLGKHLAAGKSGLVEADGRTLFLTVQVPPVRLVVIGAVHISQAMAPMAAGLDLAMTVIDPRTAFATPERFPGIALVAEWPDAALGRPRPAPRPLLRPRGADPRPEDRRPAAQGRTGGRMLLCRRPRLAEDPCGPRRTAHGGRVQPEQIGRIRAPIGLAIGAVSPAEIALSVLAEIVATLRRAPRPEVA